MNLRQTHTDPRIQSKYRRRGSPRVSLPHILRYEQQQASTVVRTSKQTRVSHVCHTLVLVCRRGRARAHTRTSSHKQTPTRNRVLIHRGRGYRQVGFQVRRPCLRPCVFAKPIPIDEMRIRENQSAAFSHTNASSRARIKAATNKNRPHKRKRQTAHHDIFPHTQHIHNAHTCMQYATTLPGSKCTPNTHACPYDIRFIVNMIM